MAKTKKPKSKSKNKPAVKAKAKKTVAKPKAIKAKPKTGKPKAAVKIKIPAAATGAKSAKSSVKPAAKQAARSKFDFVPLDDRILIERAGTSDRTAGGLYIPDTVSERPNKGKVIAVGRGHRDAKGRTRPLDVKVGDTVLFTGYAGSEVEFDGATYMIMRESDLLGVSQS